uniref:Uncharacterized protein n=1 Tax=Rhabditophanes sp. KR3021 TaxID=114890 RepID=A0AC35TLK3_9BILA
MKLFLLFLLALSFFFSAINGQELEASDDVEDYGRFKRWGRRGYYNRNYGYRNYYRNNYRRNNWGYYYGK